MSFNYSQPFMSWAANGLNTMQNSTGIGGWVELGRTTLGSANASIDVSSLANKRYYMILTNHISNSGAVDVRIRCNGDTGSNYAQRQSINGAADSTATSLTRAAITSANVTRDKFSVGYLANLAGNEKLHISHLVDTGGSGATNDPERYENVNKWANTSNAVDQITILAVDGGTYGTGSEAVILGWDPADTHTNNFWAELASVTAGGASTNISSGTITAKKYLWVQAWLESTSAHVTNMTFNNDTTTYAYRNSDNGGTDGTSTSDSHIEIHQSTSTGIFVNMFMINNSANEKLVIGNTVGQSTAGAATAPIRREFVGKHDNTGSQITEIDLDSSSGNWSSNSIMKVWGAD